MNIIDEWEAFARYRHTRFMKSFSYHLPFGTRDAYVRETMAADLDKLTNLVRICGFLTQTKTYLFWKKKVENSLAESSGSLLPDQSCCEQGKGHENGENSC